MWYYEIYTGKKKKTNMSDEKTEIIVPKVKVQNRYFFIINIFEMEKCDTVKYIQKQNQKEGERIG